MSKVEELAMRHTRLLHAMQSGVSVEMELGHNEAHTPKHLRVGVNVAMRDIASIAQLLVRKGLITEEELWEALVSGMEKEVAEYEMRLAKNLGKEVKLH